MMRKLAAIYPIFIGFSMIAMWLMFYVTDGIPELETRPIEIYIHITAEFLTALLLIVAGYRYLKKLKWGDHLYLISMGMLLYTLINSSGYFIQNGEVPLVMMFLIFIIATLYFLIWFIKFSRS